MNESAVQRDQTDGGFFLIEQTLDVVRGGVNKYGLIDQPEFERPSRRMRLQAADFLWQRLLLLEPGETGGFRACRYGDRLERATHLLSLSREELRALHRVAQRLAQINPGYTLYIEPPKPSAPQRVAGSPCNTHSTAVDLATVIRQAVPRTGATSVQVSKATGIDARVVCQVLRRLVAGGRLRRNRISRPGPRAATWCRSHTMWRYYPVLDS